MTRLLLRALARREADRPAAAAGDVRVDPVARRAWRDERGVGFRFQAR